MYVNSLSNTDFANPYYRSEKLKKKLQNDQEINRLISFVKVQVPRTALNLVYSTSIELGEAIGKAYQLAQRDMLKLVALDLADCIKSGYHSSKEFKWPPTAEELRADEIEIPEKLRRFLLLVICGKDENYSQRVERLAFSIRADMCRAATNGKWKLVKHILLTVTLRHLYRGKDVS